MQFLNALPHEMQERAYRPAVQGCKLGWMEKVGIVAQMGEKMKEVLLFFKHWCGVSF